MNSSVKKLFYSAVFFIIFFYLLRFDFISASDHKKFRVETRKGRYGLVLRVRWGYWELWQVKHREESKRIFPMHRYDLVKLLEKRFRVKGAH